MTLHRIAADYADDEHDASRLAELATARLADRLRRAGTACVVCGRRFIAAHRDAELCSDACEQKRRRRMRHS